MADVDDGPALASLERALYTADRRLETLENTLTGHYKHAAQQARERQANARPPRAPPQPRALMMVTIDSAALLEAARQAPFVSLRVDQTHRSTYAVTVTAQH